MELSLLTENISTYLGLLTKVLSPNSQIPVLSSVLLETSVEGLIISATDLEFAVRITIPAKIEKEGGALVPGKQLLEVLSTLAHDKVSISQEKDTVVLTAGKNKFKFQSLPKEEFPKLYEEKGQKINNYTKEEYDKIFSKLVFAVSQDEARPHLTGVLVRQKNNKTDYVATDGYRLSLKRTQTKEGDSVPEEGVILSPRLLMEGLSIKDTKEITLYIQRTGNQAILETQGVILIGRLIEGTYPDYEGVLPRELGTEVVVDREEFLKGLKTVSVFARENANVINLQFQKGTVEMKAVSGSIGEGDVVMDATQTGEDTSINFNVRFLLDFLKVVSSKNITIKLNGPMDPAQFETTEDKEFLHVIMPVRIQE